MDYIIIVIQFVTGTLLLSGVGLGMTYLTDIFWNMSRNKNR